MANSFSNLLSQPLAGRVVLVRVDFNVPLVDGVVSDDTRIKASLPTINALLKAEAKVVLLAHLKRPDGQVVDSLRLNPIRDSLEQLLQQSVYKLDECVGGGYTIPIIFEDHDILVIDKPVGLIVHSGASVSGHTLVDILLAAGISLPDDLNGLHRPGIVHRLDQYTQGLMVVAKTRVAMPDTQHQTTAW